MPFKEEPVLHPGRQGGVEARREGNKRARDRLVLVVSDETPKAPLADPLRHRNARHKDDNDEGKDWAEKADQTVRRARDAHPPDSGPEEDLAKVVWVPREAPQSGGDEGQVLALLWLPMEMPLLPVCKRLDRKSGKLHAEAIVRVAQAYPEDKPELVGACDDGVVRGRLVKQDDRKTDRPHPRNLSRPEQRELPPRGPELVEPLVPSSPPHADGQVDAESNGPRQNGERDKAGA